MKKCLTFILLVLFSLALGICAGVAEDEMTYTCGDYKYVLLLDGTAEITRYTGSDSGLSIPTALDEHQVTSIGDDTFSYNASLISISIPDSVTSIENNPFIYCTHLTTINVSPNHPTLATIDGILFEKNSKKLIFYPCALNNTSYTIPAGIKIIGDSAFYYCFSLTNISISDSVTYIGNAAFYHCSSLTSISIPDSVTYIGNAAFSFCSSLSSISIPDSVTYIGNSAFYGCPKNLIFTVGYGSYAETYCKENNLPYQLQESSPDDWLLN